MDLAAYLDRIGHTGPVRPDLATFRALHRAHLLAIPYENLDVQLGRRVTTDPAAAYDKIVRRGRGGWCYEMNGLFAWALDRIGFSVMRIAGAANRALLGDPTIGNHLVLLVDLPGARWVADVGFGDGSIAPFKLAPWRREIEGFPFRLEAMADGWWRFHNHPNGGAKSFDFQVEPADPRLLAGRCDWLQDAPDSGYVLNLIAQRHRAGKILQLRGRVFRELTQTNVESRTLESAGDLVATLKRDFDLDLPEAADLWPKVAARHEAVMAEAEASELRNLKAKGRSRGTSGRNRRS
jgi:N-hydroxyarylamine O-acetyltransferase